MSRIKGQISEALTDVINTVEDIEIDIDQEDYDEAASKIATAIDELQTLHQKLLEAS